MILAALLLTAPAAPPALEEPDITNEIVVIGNQLQKWKARVRSRDGELVCDIRTSTGDAEIDRIGCAAMVGCIAEVKPELDAAAALDLPRKQRNARMVEIMASQEPCIMERRASGIAELARQRAAG